MTMLKKDKRILILRYHSIIVKTVKFLQMKQDQKASLELTS